MTGIYYSKHIMHALVYYFCLLSLSITSNMIESPCAYAQGIIPSAPGYTEFGQLSAKLHLASHVTRMIPCGHRVHPRADARGFVPR